MWCAQLLLALTHLVVEDALGDECAVHPGKLHPAMLHLCRTAKTQNILVFSILLWLNTNVLSDPIIVQSKYMAKTKYFVQIFH